MSGHAFPDAADLLVWAALAFTSWPTLIVLARRVRVPEPTAVAAILSWLIGRGLLSVVIYLAPHLTVR